MILTTFVRIKRSERGLEEIRDDLESTAGAEIMRRLANFEIELERHLDQTTS